MRYQKHESFWADTRVYLQIFMRALLFGIAFQLIFLVWINHDVFNSLGNMYTKDNVKLPSSVALKYYIGFNSFITKAITVEKELIPYSKGWSELPKEYYRAVVDYATDNAYKQHIDRLNDNLKWSVCCYILSLIYLFLFLRNKTDDEKYIRGAKKVPLETLNRYLDKANLNNSNGLRIGNTMLPVEMETKHMLILGTSGSGKGVLLNQFVKQINLRPQQKCIFYDIKGEFIEKQYSPEDDLIFSPFDARSLKWNLFNEIEIPPDFDVLSRSLFSTSDEKNMYWYNCAGDVFRTGLIYLKLNKQTTNRDIWDFFSLSVEEIVDRFKVLPLEYQGAIKHIDKTDAPASASIISILQERIQFFKYLIDVDGDFSFRKYIREEQEQKQNLFILNIEQYNIIFRPLMTLTIEMMCREALSLPDDPERRIFFILDELGTLGKMESILQLLTVGRSKGSCLFCASQDLGRIESQYGHANLKTFFNNFNTTFTFRIREPETAEFLSKAIGDHQVLKTSESFQVSTDKKSFSEHEKSERLILPTQFQDLPDLTAIINIASFGISEIEVPPIFYPKINPQFIMRKFQSMELENEYEVADAVEMIQNDVEEIKSAKETRMERFKNLDI
jgi:type IV secretory pathway TraG/TraD family ATPase VirD4